MGILRAHTGAIGCIGLSCFLWSVNTIQLYISIYLFDLRRDTKISPVLWWQERFGTVCMYVQVK